MKNKFTKYLMACICLLAVLYSPNLMAQCVVDNTCAGDYANIVIGEVSGDSSQSDACEDAIVEIIGPPGASIGCMVITDTEWAVLIPPGTVLPADGVYMIGCSASNDFSCGVGNPGQSGLIGGTTNACEGGGNEGDFNIGLLPEIDFDTCDPNNAQYYDPAATGFTLDNPGPVGANGDGEQVFLFLPDGTPWDGIFWDNGGAGAADHVSVSVNGVPYTLGDNDGNGVVNDVATTVPGGRGDGGNATAVPFLPTDAACPCNTPDNPGTFTVPPTSDPIWFEWQTPNGDGDYAGCNSSFIRGPLSGMGYGGSPSHTDGLITSTTLDASGQPVDNGGGIAGTTGDAFTPGAYTPSSCGDPAAEWGYTDHPTPGQPNNDPTHVFYTSVTSVCDINDPITFTVEIYNYQNVSDGSIDSALGASSGCDNANTGSLVYLNGTVLNYDSYAVSGETTTMTFTYPSATNPGPWIPGANSVSLVWDDWSNTNGTGGNPATQNNPNECYETFEFEIIAAEPMVATDLAISCQAPNDEDASPGTINFSDLILGGANVTYELLDNGVAVDGPNDSGVFAILGTYAGPLTVEVTDGSGCTLPITITVDNDCRQAPPCPSIDTSVEDDVDDLLCPGDQVCFDLTGTDLPEGGTIDFYYDTTTGFDPYAGEGTYLGSANIISTPTPGCVASTVTIPADGSAITAYDDGGANAFGLNSDIASGNAYELNAAGVWQSTPAYGGFGTPNGPGVGIYISQFVYDPDENGIGGGCTDGNSWNTNANAEVVEITAPAGTDLSCYVLTDGEGTITFPPGTIVPASGVIVIGTTCAAATYPNVDVIVNGNNLTSGSFILGNTSDQLVLFDDMGNVVDGLAYNAGQTSDDGTFNTAAIPGEDSTAPEQFCTTFDDAFCNLSANGDFFVTGIINPFIENNTVAPFCLSSDADKSTNEFMLNMSCPEATLTAASIDVCLDDLAAPQEVNIPVTITGGAGPYTVVYSIDGTDQAPISIASGGTIDIPGPTTGTLVIVLESVTDEGGALCEGIVGQEEVEVTIRPSFDVTLVTSTNPTVCTPCDGTLTFDFANGTSTTNPFELIYTVDGAPVSILVDPVANPLPIIIMDACPGVYDIDAAIDDEGGCTVNVISNEQTLTSPAAQPVVVTIQPPAVCDDGTFTVDLATDATYTPAYLAADFAFYTVDPTFLPASALMNTPPLLTSTVVTVTESATYYAVYTDPDTGCQSITAINITANNALCLVPCPVIGAVTDPADVCEGGTFDLVATGLDDMANADNNETDFGIDFVHFGADVALPADPYTGGTSLGTVAFAALTGADPSQTATLTATGGALTAGTYQICAILTPTSVTADCRPSQCIEVVVNDLPTIADNSVCVGETVAMVGSGTAAAATPYVSDDTDVATVADDGTVTGVAAGTATITYTDENGCTDTATVTVNDNPTIDALTLCVGDPATLITFTGTPGAFVSSDTGVATVDATGNVTAVAAGSADITFTDDGNCDATATVTVVAPPAAPTVANVEICDGGDTTITPTPDAPPAAFAATWDFEGGVDDDDPAKLNGTSDNGVIVPGSATLGAGVGAATFPAGSGSTDGFSTNTWTQPDEAGALANDDYFEFCVTANGSEATITGFTFDERRSGTGPADFSVFTSADNFAASVSTGTSTDGAYSTVPVALNETICDGETLCVRIYGYNNTNAGGTWRVDNVAFTGTAGATTSFNYYPTMADAMAGTNALATDQAAFDPGTTTATSPQTVCVTATSGGDCAASCESAPTCITVTVNDNPTLAAAEVCVGSTVAMVGSGTAAAATPYVSDDTAVATVDDAGTVTGVAAGTANITYTDDNGCSVAAVVTVNDVPTLTPASVCVGQTVLMIFDNTPAAATPFVSDDISVATIDDSGNVTGVAVGTANITYTDDNTCTATAVVTVTAQDVTSFTYNDFCENTAGNLPDLTGATPGGTFTFNPDLADGSTINAATGEITNGVAGATYTVNYATTGACAANTDATVTVLAEDDATFALTDYCFGAANAASGIVTAGGTFAFNPAVADGATVNAATGEITGGVAGTTYTIEYTTAGVCPASTTQTVDVLPLDDATFALTDYCFGAANAASGIVTAGGAFAFNPAVADGATINAATGEITDGVAGTTYTIEYTTAGACPNTSTQTVDVLPLDDATFALTDYCFGAANAASGIVTTGGAFAFNPAVADGATIDAATAEITNGVAGTTYTVEYTTAGTCPNTSTQMVAVLPLDDASFEFANYCDGAANGPSNIATAGGAFVFNPVPADGATIDAGTGVITGGVVNATYTVEYTTAGTCSAISTAMVMVTSEDDASFTFAEFCIGATNAASDIVTAGGVFAFNPAPVDAATIDAATGEISGATAGVTYTVEYTTVGACSASTTQSVTPVACAPVLDVCNCDGTPGDLFVISEPGTYNDDADHNHIYILVDADGNIVTTSTDGNFAGVTTGAYEIYAFNYALSTEAALPDYSAGMPISNLTDPATFDGTDAWNSIEPCYEVKGPAVASVNECIPVLAATSNPELCAGLDMIDLTDYTPAVMPMGIMGAGQWYTGTDNTGTMVSGMQMVADGDQFYYEYISDAGCPASATITVTAVAFDAPDPIDPIAICTGDGSTLITPQGGGQLAADLFISEYVEGSGFNKCIEVYNATGATVNLSNYWIDIYTGGGDMPNSSSPFTLEGTLANGGTYVVCSNNQDLGADFAATADLLLNLNYNGDDAVALVNNGTIIDIVGNIGCDPGAQWNNGTNSTQNETLVRNACVSSGAIMNDADCSFSALTEWMALGQDVATNLGAHTSVQYNFYSDEALTDLLAGPTDSYDPGASGTYYVTAACDGCQSEAVAVTVSVNDVPVLEAIADPEICDDGSETLTFSTLNPTVTTGDATGTYTWYADNGFGGPDTSSEITSTTIGGTYWVVYTDGTDTACSTQTSISVTTAPCTGPCDGFSVAMVTNIDECEGASTTDLTITPTGGGTTDNTATGYNFYADDMGTQGAFIVSGTSYAPTVAAGSSVTIWVTAISGTPCESSAVPVTVSVEAAASATVTATATICNTTEGGNTASVDLSTLVTAGDMTGTWTLDTDPMTAITSFSGVDNGAGTYNLTYTLAAADGSACEDVTYPVVITVDNCVSVCPTVSLVSGISGDRCDDDLSISAEIGLTDDAFLSTTSVQWYLDGEAIDGETGLTYSGSVEAPSCGSASYTLSAIATCDAVGSTPTTLDAGTITVYSAPELGTDFDEPTLDCNTALVNVCAGATVTYTVNGDPVVGTLENLNLGDADATIGYTVSIPGAPDGCEASGSYDVTCPPAPECAIITIPIGNGITETCGDDVNYEAEIELIGGNTNTTIEWFVNGQSVGTGVAYDASFEAPEGSCNANIYNITAEVLCETDNFPTTVDVGSVILYSAPVAGVDFFEPTEECTATLDLGDCEIATVNYTVNGEAIVGTPVNVVDGDVIGYTVSLGSADECSVSGEYTYNCLVQECPIVNVLSSEDTDLCDDGTGSAEITGSIEVLGGLNTNTTIEWSLNGEIINGSTGTDVVVLLSPPSDPCSSTTYELTAVATCDLDGSTTELDVSTVTLYPTPFAGVQFDEPTDNCQVALIETCDNLTVTYTIDGQVVDPTALAEGESATVEYTVSGDNGCSANGSFDVSCPLFACDTGTIDNPIEGSLCAGDDLSISANIDLAGGENTTSTVEWFLNGASVGTGESFSGMAMASTDNCSATTSNLTAVVTCSLDGSTTEINAGSVTVYGIPQANVDYTLPDNCNAALAIVCDGVNVSYTVNGEAVSDLPAGLTDGDQVTYAIGINGAPDGCAAVGAYTYSCPVDCPTISLDGDTPSDITICSGESVTAGVVFENATEDQIVWNTGDTGSTLDLGVLTNDDCDSQSMYYSATIAGDGDSCPLVVAGFTVTVLADPSNQVEVTVSDDDCGVSVTAACDGFQIQYAVDGGDMQNGDSYSLDAGEDEILNASVQFSITSPECDTYETEITSLVCVGPPSPPNPCLNNNVELFEDCDIESGILTITGVISGGEAPYQITGTGGIDYGAYQDDSFIVSLSFDEWDGIVEYTVTDADGCTQVVSLSPGSCEPTVPVELLVFTGDVAEEGNNLMWITATEINVSHFDLLRSVDGVNFERIADVTAVGNSTLANNYDYLDKDAPQGTSYYRLETYDNDGSMDQSEVIALTRGATNLNILSIAPVPVEDVLQLNFSAINEVTIEISIYDVTGRTVMTRSINPSNGLNTIDIEMSAYAAGAYIIQLTNGETEQSRKFIKK